MTDEITILGRSNRLVHNGAPLYDAFLGATHVSVVAIDENIPPHTTYPRSAIQQVIPDALAGIVANHETYALDPYATPIHAKIVDQSPPQIVTEPFDYEAGMRPFR